MSNNSSSPVKLPLKRSSSSSDDPAKKKLKFSSSSDVSETVSFNDNNPIVCKFSDIKKMLLWLVLSAISYFFGHYIALLYFCSFQFSARVINASPATQVKYGERTFTQAHVDLLDDSGTIMRCQASGDSLCQKMLDNLMVTILVILIIPFREFKFHICSFKYLLFLAYNF